MGIKRGEKMKIDSYIRHLELQKSGLKCKLTKILKKSDKNYLKKGLDPDFHFYNETRQKIKEINNKLDFLKKLREELIKNEMQDKKNKRR